MGPTRFSATVKRHIPENLDLLVCQIIEGLLEVFDLLTQKITQLDQQLLQVANQDKDVQLLIPSSPFSQRPYADSSLHLEIE